MMTYHLVLSDKRMETPDTASLWLAVPTNLRSTFAFQPGQFITLAAELESARIQRQYSLSSSPSEHSPLRITVKKIPGGRMSSWLVDGVSIGDRIECAPPRGRFFQPVGQPHRVIMLAAGSGITPMVPIARQLARDRLGHQITLVSGNRTCRDIIFGQEITALTREYENFQAEFSLTRPGPGWTGARGRIDAPFLALRYQQCPAAASGLPLLIYLCGPEAFMDAAEAFYADKVAAPTLIRRESFNVVLNDETDQLPISVRGVVAKGTVGQCGQIIAISGGTEYTTTIREGESVLSALIRSGADIPFACQEGTCSSCISKVQEGTVILRPSVLKTLRQSDLDEGLILPCLARPATITVRIDFDDI